MMPKVGVEPTRANAHYALNVARLPVPPLRRAVDENSTKVIRIVNTEIVYPHYLRFDFDHFTRLFLQNAARAPNNATSTEP